MSDEFSNSGVSGEVITQATMSDKSKIVAALLCFFLGMFGIHRFYLGRTASAAIMFLLSILGFFTTGIVVGIGIIIIVGCWDVIDFFRIILNNLGDAQGLKLR